MQRLKILDGVRGWGAVFVVFYHVCSEGLPVNAAIGESLRVLLPFNGLFAVLAFFAVSGFSLSVRYLADGDFCAWLRIAAGRYLRLTIPIFGTCLIVHLVMVCGFVDPPGLRLAPFSRFFNFDPTLGHLLRFSLFDVYFNYNALETYAGPLWTMSTELLGSFVVLVTIIVVRPFFGRSLLMLGLACLVLYFAPNEGKAMLALFLIGAALADWFNRGWVDAIPVPAGFALLAAGCVIPLVFPFNVTVWGAIGTSSLLLGCFAVPVVKRWLSGTVSVHLGKISFPLYLMHGPVLCFIGEPLMRHLGHGVPSRLLIQLAVVVLSFAAAYVFLPVNEFAISLSRRFARFVTSPFLDSRVAAER